jgi:hypothetical protein
MFGYRNGEPSRHTWSGISPYQEIKARSKAFNREERKGIRKGREEEHNLAAALDVVGKVEIDLGVCQCLCAYAGHGDTIPAVSL